LIQKSVFFFSPDHGGEHSLFVDCKYNCLNMMLVMRHVMWFAAAGAGHRQRNGIGWRKPLSLSRAVFQLMKLLLKPHSHCARARAWFCMRRRVCTCAVWVRL